MAPSVVSWWLKTASEAGNRERTPPTVVRYSFRILIQDAKGAQDGREAKANTLSECLSMHRTDPPQFHYLDQDPLGVRAPRPHLYPHMDQLPMAALPLQLSPLGL